MEALKDDYTLEQNERIMKLNDKWVCYDLAKELIPPELTLADKKGLESI